MWDQQYDPERIEFIFPHANAYINPHGESSAESQIVLQSVDFGLQVLQLILDLHRAAVGLTHFVENRQVLIRAHVERQLVEETDIKICIILNRLALLMIILMTNK